jgi:hypothetical protein
VHDSQGLGLPSDQALEVHQARHIGGGENFRSGLFVIVNAIHTHQARYRFFADRESATEAATFVGPSKFRERDPFQPLQELAHFVERRADSFAGLSGPQFAQAVTTRVQTNAVGKPTGQVIHFQHVGQKLTQLECLLFQSIETGTAGEHFVIVMTHHSHTASGRSNHIVVIVEDRQKTFSQWLGFAGTTRVRHGLTATGLPIREFNRDAQPFQNLDRGHADAGVELVDVTGDEQGNSHSLTVVDVQSSVEIARL